MSKEKPAPQVAEEIICEWARSYLELTYDTARPMHDQSCAFNEMRAAIAAAIREARQTTLEREQGEKKEG